MDSTTRKSERKQWWWPVGVGTWGGGFGLEEGMEGEGEAGRTEPSRAET